MNAVILIGRLTKDPEKREAGETTVTRFTIAVDRRGAKDGQQTADFPSVVAFGKTADFVAKYFRKGMRIAIEGRLQTGSYEKDGVKHYTTDVIAEKVEFCENKKEEDKPLGAELGESIDLELPFN